MTVKLPVRAALTEKGNVFLKEVNHDGKLKLERLFKKKSEWEAKNEKEYFLQAELELNYQPRTYKQNATVWKLVETIWNSQEANPPTEEEKYSLYLDLLEVYADKVKNKITGALRPVHISESNSIEGARFIDGLLYHLATSCDLDYNGQNTVVEVLQQFYEYRGSLETDPLEYKDIECTVPLTEQEYREKHPYSEASGKGGEGLHLHHILTKGAHKDLEHDSRNFLMLTNEEHRMIHDKGETYFLSIYPHLTGRFDKIKKIAREKYV